MKLYLSTISSPLGDMLLVTDEQEAVRALDFADHRARLHRGLREHYGAFELIDAAGACGCRYRSGPLFRRRARRAG